MVATIPICVEKGVEKVFACSIDFPGWCRGARSRGLAVEALAAYASRYAEVAKRAKVAFPAPAKVGERFRGGGADQGGA